MDATLLSAIRAHDTAVDQNEHPLWLGAELTFTDRHSLETHWLTDAEGGDKEPRAEALLLAIASRIDAPVSLFRAIGRQFPGEDAPRFCLAARWVRTDVRDADRTQCIDQDGLHQEPIPVPASDPLVAWLSVTPDPGVVEVNMPPFASLEAFVELTEWVYQAAEEVGLSPVRYRYDGHQTDSGGGGQLTFGGPSASESPFALRPRLLPALTQYLNNHPSLSYAFASECLGSASQGPRADEGDPTRFAELGVALDLLAMKSDITLGDVSDSLAPLLVDVSGNSHRAEINVEKLNNPALDGRGKLGLVELRALRMQPDPLSSAAVAALLRSVLARLARDPHCDALIHWGEELHDRWALPLHVERDLEAVLADLRAKGFGLAPVLHNALLETQPQPVCSQSIGRASIEIRRALEFWPLVGDVGSQEKQTSRSVDSSTARIEIRVQCPDGVTGHVSAGGYAVHLEAVGEHQHVGAVRYRSFIPKPGLHPDLAPHDPLRVRWTLGAEVLTIALHSWRADGGVYDGLPTDGAEASRRRADRVVVTRSSIAKEAASSPRGRTLDLRRLPRLDGTG